MTLGDLRLVRIDIKEDVRCQWYHEVLRCDSTGECRTVAAILDVLWEAKCNTPFNSDETLEVVDELWRGAIVKHREPALGAFFVDLSITLELVFTDVRKVDLESHLYPLHCVDALVEGTESNQSLIQIHLLTFD